MQGFSTQSISYHVGLPRVVDQTKIVVFQKLHPLSLPHVRLLLVKQILQAFMVKKHLKLHATQVVSPYLQCKHYSGQLKVVGRVVCLISLQFPKGIAYYCNTLINPYYA